MSTPQRSKWFQISLMELLGFTALVAILLASRYWSFDRHTSIEFDDLMDQIEWENVLYVDLRAERIEGKFKEPIVYNAREVVYFQSRTAKGNYDELVSALGASNTPFTVHSAPMHLRRVVSDLLRAGLFVAILGIYFAGKAIFRRRTFAARSDFEVASTRDEQSLLNTCDILERIHDDLPANSTEAKAVEEAAHALGFISMHQTLKDAYEQYRHNCELPLSEQQLAVLRSYGIEEDEL